jgi:hypothetical protein
MVLFRIKEQGEVYGPTKEKKYKKEELVVCIF